LNEIGLVTVTASRPLVFDAYEGNRATGSFLLIDPATNATAGAGLIERPVRERSSRDGLSDADAATRLVHAARSAASEDAAIHAVRRVLEEILT